MAISEAGKGGMLPVAGTSNAAKGARMVSTAPGEILLNSKTRLSEVLQGISVATLVINSEHRVIYWNHACERLTGIPAQEMLGTQAQWRAFYPEDRPILADLILEDATPQQISVQYGDKFRPSTIVDGAYECEDFFPALGEEGRWLFFTAAPVRDENGVIWGAVETLQDVSERHRLEARLQHVTKLESLGMLAGGVAHDMNNLLQAVLGNADLALSINPKESGVAECLAQIKKSSERAARLAHQMWLYTGKARLSFEHISLTRMAASLEPKLRAQIPVDIALHLECESGKCLIRGDELQLKEAIASLVENAAEAIGASGGVITIRVGMIEADHAFLSDTLPFDTLHPGVYAFIEVSDTGSGMTEEVRPRIFDPFFTTKFMGRGLGLAMVFGIVRGHKGALKVTSDPGKGSTLTVLLPVAAESSRS